MRGVWLSRRATEAPAGAAGPLLATSPRELVQTVAYAYGSLLGQVGGLVFYADLASLLMPIASTPLFRNPLFQGGG